MNILLEYKIIKELGLIIEVIKGDVNTQDYIAFKKRIVEDKEFNSRYSSIVDFRKANFSLKGIEISNEIKFFYNNVKNEHGIISNRKSAIITQSPQQVAVMTLYKYEQYFPNNREIFSTISAGLKWLKIHSITSQYIEEIITDIKRENSPLVKVY